jgi:iron complex transport system substrate-binding protein
MRVVSLLPSATEIVARLGAFPSLVGRSEECDFPPEVAALPVVMRARSLDGDRPSGEIDRRVQQSRQAGQSLYELDLGLLRALRPELLLTQDLCGVCSVTEREVVSACEGAGVAPRIVSLSPARLDDVWDSVERVGEAIGLPERGKAVATELRGRATPRERPAELPSVAVVEWLDPPILAGLWVPEMIQRAGGHTVEGAAGEPGVRTGWPELREARPDLVILSPCSFSVARTHREASVSPMREAVEALRPTLGTWIADEAYFSRPGPRLADGLELLARLVRGDRPLAPMPVLPWVHQGAVA